MSDIRQIFPVQSVRLFDVFVIAPFLIYAGRSSNDKVIKYGLIGLGVLTALYNGVNYINNSKNGK
jgi:hypothetical protein